LTAHELSALARRATVRRDAYPAPQPKIEESACGHVTKKAKYGLKALVFLAGIERVKPRWSPTSPPRPNTQEILDAILGELRNAGFVHSKKGKGGGYTLARAPEEIGVGNVIRALDGRSRRFMREPDRLSTLRRLRGREPLRRAAGDAASPRGDSQRSRQNDVGPDAASGRNGRSSRVGASSGMDMTRGGTYKAEHGRPAPAARRSKFREAGAKPENHAWLKQRRPKQRRLTPSSSRPRAWRTVRRPRNCAR